MKEQDFLAMEKKREKDMRSEAYRKEKERISKAEQARLETERIHEAQQRVVEARKREMACRDAERESKKAEKQRIMVLFLPMFSNQGPCSTLVSYTEGGYILPTRWSSSDCDVGM